RSRPCAGLHWMVLVDGTRQAAPIVLGGTIAMSANRRYAASTNMEPGAVSASKKGSRLSRTRTRQRSRSRSRFRSTGFRSPGLTPRRNSGYRFYHDAINAQLLLRLLFYRAPLHGSRSGARASVAERSEPSVDGPWETTVA